MRIWIDISNAPHVTFFSPVAEALEERGHELLVTVHDRGQTLPLALKAWPDGVVVGSGYHRGVLAKGAAVLSLARELREVTRPFRPDIAMSHNSYPQIVAARGLHVPAITIMDYEHQPANHVAFRLASRVVVPRAIPPASLRRFGVKPARLVQYDGIKEQIALGTFRPAPAADFRQSLGVDETRPLVTLRPAAEGALYHRHRNELFEDVIELTKASGATVVLTPRTRSQGEQFEAAGVRVLREPVSGPDLLFHSDLFVGAGGTMTREAAVLGTPTVSVFAGRSAAVDEWLQAQGMLRIARTPDDLGQIRIERIPDRQWVPNGEVLQQFVTLLLDCAASTR
jgi:predicted glycosyltransferase